ncbi:MAG TPA: alpha/beta fold hydrolase [Polyangia bacterium]|jgi:pimeloyl-ACP methyl ester carboxylesterase
MLTPIDPTALPVVILNGFGTPRFVAEIYGNTFRERGFQVFTAPQRCLNYGDVRISARLAADEIARVRAVTGASKVHLVGMSLGGLTGLYYLKVLGGADSVARFVSIGGPLNGSTLALALTRVFGHHVPSLVQSAPENDLLLELRAAPPPDGVRMFSMGTRGDILTPHCWEAEGFEPVETPFGWFPVGHWMLFSHPANKRLAVELLARP